MNENSSTFDFIKTSASESFYAQKKERRSLIKTGKVNFVTNKAIIGQNIRNENITKTVAL